MKDINTLVTDIRDLLEHPTTIRPDRDLVLGMVNGLAKAAVKPLEKRTRSYSLRMSNIGKGIRKHWYESQFGVESADAESQLRFVVGDFMEEYLFFLAKLSGHTVTHQQETVVLEGVEGHIDAVFDGYNLIDGKTCSDNNYKKFTKGLEPWNDEYGYIYQMAGYYQGLLAKGLDIRTTSWFAINKSNSNFGLFNYSIDKLPDARSRIISIKKALDKNKAPKDICEGAAPKEAESGNKEMSFLCRFCPFKDKCWPDYKVYRYSNTDKMYTEVVKQPRVEEVTHEYRS